MGFCKPLICSRIWGHLWIYGWREGEDSTGFQYSYTPIECYSIEARLPPSVDPRVWSFAPIPEETYLKTPFFLLCLRILTIPWNRTIPKLHTKRDTSFRMSIICSVARSSTERARANLGSVGAK